MNRSPRMFTLAQARDELRAEIEDGATCPCCEQYAKVYHRKLNSSMARDLIALYRGAGVGQPVHLSHFLRARGLASSNDGSLLRHWGMIEPTPERDAWWRLTRRGEQFALCEITVQKDAVLYASRLLRLDGPWIDVRAALGSRFDYTELMRGSP